MNTPSSRHLLAFFDDPIDESGVTVFPQRRVMNHTLLVFGLAVAAAILCGGCGQVNNDGGIRNYAPDVVRVGTSDPTVAARVFVVPTVTRAASVTLPAAAPAPRRTATRPKATVTGPVTISATVSRAAPATGTPSTAGPTGLGAATGTGSAGWGAAQASSTPR